MNSKCRAKK